MHVGRLLAHFLMGWRRCPPFRERLFLETSLLTRGRFSAQGKRCVPFLAIVALCGFAQAAFAEGPPYTFTKIQVPGAVRTEASGINNAGQIAGTYWSSDGTVHGFVGAQRFGVECLGEGEGESACVGGMS